MTQIIEIQTERLILRRWRREDQPIFADINADPEVMRYYPRLLSAEESDAMAHKFQKLLSARGWGFWAVELIDEKSFIGFVGLHEPTYELPVSPCVEIGWRLAKRYWGKGYATEAAMASLDVAFNKLALKEVYAFTSVSNRRSRAVMERIGMINLKRNFEHPIIPQNNALREHVLYQLQKSRWLQLNKSRQI